MEIGFYEEFPNKENLKKLKLVKFPTRIFIAAHSLEEFKEYEKVAKSYKKDLEIAYWPIIKNSYYVSPFSNPRDLIETFKEFDSIKNHILIDIELPLKKVMILKNIFNIQKNKKLIQNFIDRNSQRITVPQMPFAIYSKFFKWVGLVYEGDYEKNPMYYTSMFSEKINSKVKEFLVKCKNKSEYAVGLGTIARGVVGTELILPAEKLREDLEFMKNHGFEKAIIFRLGGLNKEYVKVLEKFV